MIGSKALARTAGALYLALAGFGLYAEMIARQGSYVAGDAAATAANIAEHSGTFRAGIVADILMAIAYIGVGVALSRLLAPVHRDGARLITVFTVAGATMILVNLALQAGALILATDPTYAAQLGTDQAQGLALLMLDVHGQLYTIGGVFFGLWLLPTGILVYRSGAFPRLLGIAVTAAAVMWLVVTVVQIAARDLGSPWLDIIDAPTSIGEFWLALYLVTVGRRSDAKIRERVPAEG